jgi:hypothetical protein
MPSNFALLKHTAPPQASEQAQSIVMSNISTAFGIASKLILRKNWHLLKII